MTKKILFVTGSQSKSGGVERACADLANQLALDPNNELIVLSAMQGQVSFFSVSTQIKLEEIYSSARSLQIYAIDYICRLRSFIKKFNPDIIIIVESFLAVFVLPATIGVSSLVINWEHFGAHTSLGTPLRRLARRAAARFCDHIVVLTDADLKLWLKKYRMNSGRISVIRNINPMYQHTSENSLPKDSKVVLAVGRLEHQKGFDLLLDAWKKIPVSSRDGWCLRIVGEGSMRAQLEAQLSKLDIQKEVELPGRINDIATEYRNAGIFVLSSRYEGFVLAMMEAMTFGLPIISFDCPTGPREIINPNQNGILVNYMDVNLLARELEVMMLSPELRRNLGSQCRNTILDYAPAKIVENWKALFNTNY